MRGITHATYGVLLGLLFPFSLHPVAAVLIALFGSLLPDIDEPSSLLGRRFTLIGWFSKHRGFWHSLVVCITGVIVGELIATNLGLLFGLGFLSHLVLDGITHAGVHPFWPSKLRVRGFVKSGGFVDSLLLLVGVCACVFVVL